MNFLVILRIIFYLSCFVLLHIQISLKTVVTKGNIKVKSFQENVITKLLLSFLVLHLVSSGGKCVFDVYKKNCAMKKMDLRGWGERH